MYSAKTIYKWFANSLTRLTVVPHSYFDQQNTVHNTLTISHYQTCLPSATNILIHISGREALNLSKRFKRFCINH